jgi:glutamine synthetase
MSEGMLTLDQLKAEVKAGAIDTVVAAMVDLQGRLVG